MRGAAVTFALLESVNKIVASFSWMLGVERVVIKTLKLNLLPISRRKKQMLAELFNSVADCCNDVLAIAKSSKPKNFAMLHNTSYRVIKRKYSLHSQILVDCIHQVWENHKTASEFKQVPIRFNIPRSGKFARTKRGNPVVVISSLNGRIALPIRQDGAYERFIEHVGDGWSCTQFRLHKKNGHYVIIAILKKVFKIRQSYQAVVGVDINSGSFALTVLRSNGRVIKQLYLGQDIWHKQWEFMKRRSKLQSYVAKGEKRARRALRRMKHREGNFVNTRVWQIAHEIVEIALKYDAVIVIEKLKNLRKKNKRGEKPKKANRKIHRIPIAKFRMAICSVAWQSGTCVIEVPAAKTSQRCPRCGHASKRNWMFFNGKRRLFRCSRCGFEGNPDRVASFNIGKLALERGFAFFTPSIQPQCSRAGGVAGHPVWLDEEVRWHHYTSESKSPTF